jgi:prepilin-type N-terminal cleavage/methylation domain-containing protein
MPVPRSRRHPSKRARQAGFSLIEVLIGTVVLVLALLGHMASTFAEYRMARTQETRSEVLHVARQFVERLRSDDDWEGLYARLRVMQNLAAKPDAGLTRLEDGRGAFAPDLYYGDFVLPVWLDSLAVLVDVPFDPLSPQNLREDLHQPRYGLPADLDGDGLIDATPHQQDYRALPVVITFRWQGAGDTPAQLRVSTWLRASL